jgi:hypothetical protein
MLPWSRPFASTSSERRRIMQSAAASRYHALDALRAALLGLFRSVRPTFIGAVLNGRTYPGALTPAIATAG